MRAPHNVGALPTACYTPAVGAGRTTTKLVTRGDDAGSFRAANAAIVEAYENGIIKNASIMVPAPHFEEAAELFRVRPGLCLGLHVTLNAEWDAPRWGPILAPSRVPSLVDAEERFLRTPMDLFERGVDLDQALSEVRAQLERARKHGLSIRYIDEHMGVGWIHAKGGENMRLRALLQRLAKDEGLVWHQAARELPPAEEVGPRPTAVRRRPWETLVGRLDQAEPGTYIFFCHPAHDTDETRQVSSGGGAPGEVAEERAADLSLATSAELRHALNERGIRCIRYDEV
jgi:predicted glycoside hydrolase/deacetylase ChbG (UPF0249 family)